MKVINLSLDKNILDKNSAVSQRALLYREKLDKYIVLVPGHGNKVLSLFKLFFSLHKILKEEDFDLDGFDDNNLEKKEEPPKKQKKEKKQEEEPKVEELVDDTVSGVGTDDLDELFG